MTDLRARAHFARLPKSGFKDAMAALEQVLSDLLEERVLLTEGAGELDLESGALLWAVQPAQYFAAAKAYLPQGSRQFLCLTLDERTVLLGDCPRGPFREQSPWWAALPATPCDAPPRVPGMLELGILAAGHFTAAQDSGQAAQLQAALHERTYFQDLIAEQAEELHRLNAKVLQLQSRGAAAPGPSDSWAQQVLAWQSADSLEGLPDWAARRIGRIAVLPRALSGAKKSLYGTPGHVYQALEFLAGEYCEYRRGELSKSQMEERLASIGCQLAGAAGATVAGEQGETYFVKWQGRKRRLDLHLRKGGGRDERYCLRIYFFWDDETRQPVVGWLPSHLDNSLT